MNTLRDEHSNPGAPAFPPEAWQRVRIESQDRLQLLGPQQRGHLAVTVINDSDQTLQAGGDLVFSFRLLDHSGAVLGCEGVRTPLTASVLPGASHQQTVTVIVPAEQLPQGVAVRIGLLREGEYWVESLYPAHPRTVAIDLPGAMTPAETRAATASQIWPQGLGNGLRWPYGTMMVADRHKLFYVPVAKCACTSLKSLMARLAGIDNPDIAQELDIHYVTDEFNTGALLKDRSLDEARAILASDQYFKFSVIRDPLERLVSAYLEKFVYNRGSPANLAHTRPVVSAIQGTQDIDLDRGISFNQFLDFITRQDPFDLDAHWRPQHHYFIGVRNMSQIFRLDNIQALEQYLLQHHGIETQLGHKNKTRTSDVILPEAPQLTAGELDQQGAISAASFLTSENSALIGEYYPEDIELYQAAP